MLNLLHLHHRVCYGKSEGLGMTFIGTAPFVFHGEKSPSKNWVLRQQMDVLKVLRDGTETLFYINSQKRIVAGEYFSFPGAEPCVVEFHGEKQSGEWTYPARILALRGGQVFADLRVESFDVGGTEPREEPCVGDRGDER